MVVVVVVSAVLINHARASYKMLSRTHSSSVLCEISKYKTNCVQSRTRARGRAPAQATSCLLNENIKRLTPLSCKLMITMVALNALVAALVVASNRSFNIFVCSLTLVKKDHLLLLIALFS